MADIVARVSHIFELFTVQSQKFMLEFFGQFIADLNWT